MRKVYIAPITEVVSTCLETLILAGSPGETTGQNGSDYEGTTTGGIGGTEIGNPEGYERNANRNSLWDE